MHLCGCWPCAVTIVTQVEAAPTAQKCKLVQSEAQKLAHMLHLGVHFFLCALGIAQLRL